MPRTSTKCLPVMSKKIEECASIKIETKRKRAPVMTHATRFLCEQAIASLVNKNLVKYFNTPDRWMIHPSTEVRKKELQHERKLSVKNYLGAWHVAKMR